MSDLAKYAAAAAERARKASNRAFIAAIIAIACSCFSVGFALRGILDGLGS